MSRETTKKEGGSIVKKGLCVIALLAFGLVNYSADDLVKIHRRHSTEIEMILGYAYGDEVIHRNNLVLL